jgi:hypothetical protein
VREERPTFLPYARGEIAKSFPERNEVAMLNMPLFRPKGVRDRSKNTFRLSMVDYCVVSAQVAERAAGAI